MSFSPKTRTFGRVKVTFAFDLTGGPGDPNLADNSRSVTWIFCGDLDKTTECK